MVSELIIALASAIAGGIFVLGGAVATGYLDLQRSKIEQQEQNNRIFAQHMAEQEANAIRELSLKLEQCNRIYGEGVRHAAVHVITEEDYESDINGKYREFQQALEEPSVFLDERAEAKLTDYLTLLRKSDDYIRWKVHQLDSPEVRETISGNAQEIDQLIEQDDPPDYANVQFSRMDRIHYIAKVALREEISYRLNLITPDNT